MVKITKKQEREVLREDMSSNIKLILEQNTELLKLPPLFKHMAGDIETLKSDVEVIKVGQKGLQEDVGTLKEDVKRIDSKLDNKVDRSEFERLERRIARSA